MLKKNNRAEKKTQPLTIPYNPSNFKKAYKKKIHIYAFNVHKHPINYHLKGHQWAFSCI